MPPKKSLSAQPLPVAAFDELLLTTAATSLDNNEPTEEHPEELTQPLSGGDVTISRQNTLAFVAASSALRQTSVVSGSSSSVDEAHVEQEYSVTQRKSPSPRYDEQKQEVPTAAADISGTKRSRSVSNADNEQTQIPPPLPPKKRRGKNVEVATRRSPRNHPGTPALPTQYRQPTDPAVPAAVPVPTLRGSSRISRPSQRYQ